VSTPEYVYRALIISDRPATGELPVSKEPVTSPFCSHPLRPSGCQPSGKFHPCRSSRLRRFTPLRTLQAYFILQTIMGFAVFRAPCPGVHELRWLGLPTDLMRLGQGTHPQQRDTLRSFSLLHSVSDPRPKLDSDCRTAIHQPCAAVRHSGSPPGFPVGRPLCRAAHYHTSSHSSGFPLRLA